MKIHILAIVMSLAAGITNTVSAAASPSSSSTQQASSSSPVNIIAQWDRDICTFRYLLIKLIIILPFIQPGIDWEPEVRLKYSALDNYIRGYSRKDNAYTWKDPRDTFLPEVINAACEWLAFALIVLDDLLDTQMGSVLSSNPSYIHYTYNINDTPIAMWLSVPREIYRLIEPIKALTNPNTKNIEEFHRGVAVMGKWIDDYEKLFWCEELASRARESGEKDYIDKALQRMSCSYTSHKKQFKKRLTTSQELHSWLH